VILPVVMALVFLPMALGWIGPNPVYSYRTARSLSTPELWYPANQLAGSLGLAFSLSSLLINLSLLRSRRLGQETRSLAGVLVFAAAMLVCAGTAILLNG
jgi:uncharacterized membrane protein